MVVSAAKESKEYKCPAEDASFSTFNEELQNNVIYHTPAGRNTLS